MARQTRPFIGVNADFVPPGKRGPARLHLHAGYADAVAIAGGYPVVMTPFGPDVDLDPVLDRLDGIILTGGLDLDPRRYGLPTHPAVVAVAERRDCADRELVRRVIDRQLPVLGIGLGMQQLNVALGGTLYLHLPEEMPRSMPHLDLTGGPHRHLVLLEAGTRVDEIYGGGELRVNSQHHQAVREPGSGLRIAARSPDGVIEAVEACDPNWFCIGVQWHPESETASALDLQLFEAFIQACLRQAQPLQLAA
jgi:putative glutamine amidotransferase